MQSYYKILTKFATSKGVNLKQAFVKAGVRDSTYYRAKRLGHDLRYETAKQVYDFIDQDAEKKEKAERR